MADDPANFGVADRSRVNVNEDYELQYWSERFGVSQDRLKSAVDKVGASADAVERELAGGPI
jgi:hypothetical protein